MERGVPSPAAVSLHLPTRGLVERRNLPQRISQNLAIEIASGDEDLGHFEETVIVKMGYSID